MARIRSIHPGVYTDVSWTKVPIEARWLAMGLAVEADDNGVFVWEPVQIKMRIFPGDNIDVEPLLDALLRAHILAKYGTEERSFGVLRNFRKYQRPKKPNYVHILPDKFRTFVGLTNGSSEPDLISGGTGPPSSDEKGGKSPQMEGRGEESREGKRKNPPSSDSMPSRFQEFYAAYPRKKARGSAAKAFLAAEKKTSAETIIAAARAYAAKCVGKDPEFIPYPASWLNAESWADAELSEQTNGQTDGADLSPERRAELIRRLHT